MEPILLLKPWYFAFLYGGMKQFLIQRLGDAVGSLFLTFCYLWGVVLLQVEF